jgi:hypothetical protein
VSYMRHEAGDHEEHESAPAVTQITVAGPGATLVADVPVSSAAPMTAAHEDHAEGEEAEEATVSVGVPATTGGATIVQLTTVKVTPTAAATKAPSVVKVNTASAGLARGSTFAVVLAAVAAWMM